ncbi:unnamed protein product [Fraxinus pennsylvanica]|uniref:Protein kinase domain-containing protein n=1 Tax=Fraxinus pennsylvanica TaxID=56036 RepID=A0AAD2E0T5_9LAMI|nr:unnamed protein product [Fraxinus pennsylvanica]
MSCFSCFSSREKKLSERPATEQHREPPPQPLPQPPHSQPQLQLQLQLQLQQNSQPLLENPRKTQKEATNNKATDKGGNNNIAAQTFTFRELATATKKFRQECLIGEGGFGRVYKGHLDKTGQIVAVKQLDRNGLQGNKEFLVEVLMLSLLHHQHLPYRRNRYKTFVTALQAEPIFKEQNRFSELVDPLLKEDFPKKSFNQAVAVAAMCLQDESSIRPLMSDVVTALSYLGTGPETGMASAILSPSPGHSPRNNEITVDESSCRSHRIGLEFKKQYEKTYLIFRGFSFSLRQHE